MKIACDTNVLVAGLVAEGLCRDIVKRRLASVQLVTSRALLDELARVLRHKFDTDPDEVTFLQAYRDQATIVRPAPLPRAVCRDRDDDNVLAAAITGKTDLIVTGDEDLLVLGQHCGIRILSPRQFVELLDRGR